MQLQLQVTSTSAATEPAKGKTMAANAAADAQHFKIKAYSRARQICNATAAPGHEHISKQGLT